MWTQVGSSYLATTFGIDVADDTRTVDTRLAIRNGNVGIGTAYPSSQNFKLMEILEPLSQTYLKLIL
jgi:hypothetical protein